MHQVGCRSGISSKTVRPSSETVAALIRRGPLVVVVRAVIVGPLQRPSLDRSNATGRRRPSGRDGPVKVIAMPSLPGVQLDRHAHRLAGGADPVEAAGLGPVAGPGEHAAGVELAVGRMEPAAHHAGRERRQSAGRTSPPASGRRRLVRHDEDLAVAVREVEQRAPQRPPGGAGALDPDQLGRRAVEGVGDPADAAAPSPRRTGRSHRDSPTCCRRSRRRLTQLIRFLGVQKPSWSVRKNVPSGLRQTPLAARKPVARISVGRRPCSTRSSVPCCGTTAVWPCRAALA